MGLPNELQVGRYSLLLRRLLDMLDSQPMPTLATDLFPVLTIESDRPEWAFLKGEHLYSTWNTAAAAVGKRGSVVLVNGPSSGMLAVVERIIVIVDGLVNSEPTVRTQVVTTGGAAGLRGISRDTREWATGSACSTITNNTLTFAQHSGNQLGVPLARVINETTAYTVLEWRDPVILGPDTNVGVVTAADNVGMGVTFVWRERALERSEIR